MGLGDHRRLAYFTHICGAGRLTEGVTDAREGEDNAAGYFEYFEYRYFGGV